MPPSPWAPALSPLANGSRATASISFATRITGAKPVKLDKVTFKFISDPTAAFAAMMAGDLDAFPVFPAPENLVQFEADPRFR
jgi:ABC-type transport system substrate-binding protein